MKMLNWALSILFIFLQLLLIECSSRWWIVNYGDPLQRARRVLTPDNQLGWRTRSNLNLLFEEKRLVTDNQGLRIPSEAESDSTSKQTLVLGPSSAFGWGVNYEEAWPALIEGNNVWNASQVGYSIVQGKKIYEKLNQQGLSGIHTAIIAYGVNDIDRFRFFDQQNVSDVEYFKQLDQSQLAGAFYASGVLSLLARGYQEAGIYFHCGYKQPPVQRVGVESFAVHLKDLILKLRQDNMKVLLVNSANAIQVEPSDHKAEESDRLYQESADAAAQEKCSLSRRLFFEAKKYESWRVIRDINRINDAIARVGTELNVPIVDIAGLLEGEERKSFFVDPIHFSVKGHQVAAEAIKKALKELN